MRRGEREVSRLKESVPVKLLKQSFFLSILRGGRSTLQGKIACKIRVLESNFWSYFV